MSQELFKLIFWNPRIQIPGVILMFFMHFNAYIALWSLYCELLGYFLHNSCDLTRIVITLRVRADAIAIRNDLFVIEI